MKFRYAKKSWRDLLPTVFSWLDKVSFEKHEGSEGTAHYVVPYLLGADKKTSFCCGCSGKGLENKISDALKARGCDEATPGVYSVEGGEVALASITKFDVSTAQKGREVGIKAAASLKGLSVDNLVVFEGEGVSAYDVFDGMVQAWYSLESFKDKPVATKLPSNVFLCTDSFLKTKLRT